jgi:hypothetical protein
MRGAPATKTQTPHPHKGLGATMIAKRLKIGRTSVYRVLANSSQAG